VFVESKNDVDFYQELYRQLKKRLKREISLSFIASGVSKIDNHGLEISFDVDPNAKNGVTDVSLASAPALITISDGNGNLPSASYQDGAVTISETPATNVEIPWSEFEMRPDDTLGFKPWSRMLFMTHKIDIQ
jgi:hypothetical protein